eukprot:scaffold180988_cov35-Tisochrysis_lutea.AAC.1
MFLYATRVMTCNHIGAAAGVRQRARSSGAAASPVRGVDPPAGGGGVRASQRGGVPQGIAR